MKVDINVIKNIYDHLGDEVSKELFKARLMYSITGDVRWVREMVYTIPEGRDFLDKLKKVSDEGGELVLFGAGARGNRIYQLFPSIPWKCVVDNAPKASLFHDLPVIQGSDFIKTYSGEYVVISALFNHEEIFTQLIAAGIPAENIFDTGEVDLRLTSKQYFELPYLQPAMGKEIFLDAGALDGMSTVDFYHWSKGEGFSYLFEPDPANIIKCQQTLEDCHLEHKLIPKGVWSSETELRFMAGGHAGSSIDPEGNIIIPVTAIDQEIGNQEVTFIKMDVEGAEREALIGAERTIRQYHPKLAICVYHKPEDIWELPELILQYNPAYRLYLRHYFMTHTGDTILYAIP